MSRTLRASRQPSALALLLALLLPPTVAQTLKPPTDTATLRMARRQSAEFHYAEAARLFRMALGGSHRPLLSPEDAIAFATALSATGDSIGAQQVVAAALARSPRSALLNDAQGTLLAQSGDLDNALTHFRLALQTDPGFARALYHLGAALLALNNPVDAIPVLQSAAGRSPNDFDVRLQLGRALSAEHRDPEALLHLHRAAELRTPTTAYEATYALALALQASGDSKAALPLFTNVLTDPAFAGSAALTNAALAHVQTGDVQSALPLYTRALRLGPDTAILREDFGVAFLQESDLDHAIEQFRAGLALETGNAHLHYDLGLALKLKDQLAAAIPEFERSAELDPALPDPPYTLGVILMQLGRLREAAAQLETATSLAPRNGDAWALLGSVRKDLGDAEAATTALQRAIDLLPEQPSLHIQLAQLESQTGQKEAAAAERKIAADLSRTAMDRQRASFALRSGRLLLQQNKLPEAVQQLTAAAAADPHLAEPHSLLADAYDRQGKMAEAALERRRAASTTRASP